MLHPIYTSVNTANIVLCSKEGTTLKRAPVPLIRDKYLGEYRTELEKAKVRKNLGIPDELIITLTEEVSKINNLLETDLKVKLNSNTNTLIEVNSSINRINSSIEELNRDLSTIKDKLNFYDTSLTDITYAPNTVGGISSGTQVGELKGKSFSEILDQFLFPVSVKPLVNPTLRYSSIPTLVVVGSVVQLPELIFELNDAGNLISKTSKLTFAGSEATLYDKLGSYLYTGTASYEAGNYLINNRDETTNLRVDGGTITTTLTVTTTYPWYINNFSLDLVPFGIDSKEFLINLNGNVVIKLPGSNSVLRSFKVGGGLGFLDVDITGGWDETLETLHGILYRVFTKKDAYNLELPHKLSFNLSL